MSVLSLIFDIWYAFSSKKKTLTIVQIITRIISLFINNKGVTKNKPKWHT